MDTSTLVKLGLAAVAFILATGYNLQKLRSTTKAVAALNAAVKDLKEVVAVQSSTIAVLCERLTNEKERLNDVRGMLRDLLAALKARRGPDS